MNNRQTLSEWFQLYSDDVYHFLVYYTGSKDVEDLVQDVFIKAGRGMSSFKQKSTPKTWLFSIARNMAIDEARKKQRRGLDAVTEFDDRLSVGSHLTPEQHLLYDEDRQKLYRTINELKQTYRDVIMIRTVNDCSIAETAEILGWKQTKVKTTYHRAMKALQKQLWKKGEGHDAKSTGY